MNEIRKKIVQFHTSGKGPSEIVRLMKVEKVNRMMVYRTLKRFNETCSVEDRLRPGRPTCVRTSQLKNVIRCRISRNPRRSMRKMARELKVSKESLRKLVRSDLGLKSLKRRTGHHLTPAIREKRLKRCRGLLRRLAQIPDDKILFSDEKLFTVEESFNRQNDMILA